MKPLPQLLAENGYTHLVELDGKLCGILAMAYTWAIVVGLTKDGRERRYCFERWADAVRSINEWDGTGHPPGPWLKVKGRFNGEPIDAINPKLEFA